MSPSPLSYFIRVIPSRSIIQGKDYDFFINLLSVWCEKEASEQPHNITNIISNGSRAQLLPKADESSFIKHYLLKYSL